MTQAANRLAIVLAGAWRSEPSSAARASSSETEPSGLAPPGSRGIKMAVSPNRPTRPGPGSIPIRVVSCSIVASSSSRGQRGHCVTSQKPAKTPVTSHGDGCHVGAEGVEALGDVRVPAVDEVTGADQGLALGGQAGQHQRDPGPQ